MRDSEFSCDGKKEGQTMGTYSVIDADGHVRESISGIREFLEPRWQRRNLFPNDEWDRDLRGKLGAKPEGPDDQLAAMERDGIDVMVLYPTAGLHVAALHERDYATAITPRIQRLALSFL
jgi:hypothetical protein